MKETLVLALALLGGCQFMGAQSFLGTSRYDMNFAEVDFIYASADSDRSFVQMIPFIAFGQGILPLEWSPTRDNFDRASVGSKARFPIPIPIPFFGGRVSIYLEAGAMVSYYDGESITTPVELEGTAGLGTSVGLGNGWWVDLAARIRKPFGNGYREGKPDHAPHGIKGEVAIGIRKDF